VRGRKPRESTRLLGKCVVLVVELELELVLERLYDYEFEFDPWLELIEKTTRLVPRAP
jgi:hypothetical protein